MIMAKIITVSQDSYGRGLWVVKRTAHRALTLNREVPRRDKGHIHIGLFYRAKYLLATPLPFYNSAFEKTIGVDRK